LPITFTAIQQPKNITPCSSGTARQNGFRSTQRTVAEFKQVKVEKPIRPTPTWEQFLEIVDDIRKQKFNADANNSANLVDFMGRAGLGTAECANLLGEHINPDREQVSFCRRPFSP
jgi:hypothetical protein